jgi:hypothetical protein
LDEGETIKKIGNTQKEIVFCLGWGVAGFLSWYISLIIFSNWTHSLVPLLRKMTASLGLTSLYLTTQHIAFHLSDYVLAVIFVALLTRWCGYKKSTLVTFVFGATIVTFISSLESLSAYMDIYPKLPSWVISYFCSSMIYVFVLLPLSAWIGTIVGRQFNIAPPDNATCQDNHS